MTRKPHKQSIVLSPHYDDAVFSCGAAIHRWIREGTKVLVVNICAASPESSDALSPLAQEFHDSMGGGDVVDMRRKEDHRAIDSLGAEHVELSFRDCIYRGPEDMWFYQELNQIFGKVHPAESRRHELIRSEIEEKIALDDNCTVYAPLGIGRHVDHQIVFACAKAIQASGVKTLYYEDYPYADTNFPHPLDAGNSSSLNELISQFPQMMSSFLEVTEADLVAKVGAVMTYSTQLAVMFGNVESVAGRVRAFAEEGDRLVERFWALDS